MTLKRRIKSHRDCYVRYKNGKACKCKAYDIFDRGDYEFEIVEDLTEHGCDKDDLLKIEAWYIRNFECLNEQIPGRTCKQWREENKEYLKEQNKKWRENNKEHSKQQQKEYHEANREKRNQQCRERRNANIEQARAKDRERDVKQQCPHCNEWFRRSHISRHIKRKHS
jgi:hypothetical protein